MGKVVITDHGFPSIDPERSILEEAGFEVREVKPDCKTAEDVIRECKDADVLLVQWAPITREVFESLPNVKCVVRYGIGVNNIDLKAAKDLGVMVANVPDYCLEEVSNHAITMVMALARRMPHDHYQLTHGGWGIGPFFPFPGTSEMTLGLVGFGNIARTVAKKAAVFGFDIVAYDPFIDDSVFASAGVKKVDLDTLLSTSDAISVHCPLTESTTHLINKSSFDKMKTGAIIVNTSRGPVINEADLIAALQSGKLAGAGIDVYETEPPAVDNPLRSMTNVLLTSHAASASANAEIMLQIKPAEAARDFLLGKRPRSVVV